MTYRTRVADSFARLSADQLVRMAGGVIAGLTNNPAFPAPAVDIKNAKCYEVRSAAMGTDGGTGPWQAMGLFTSSRSMKIAGLITGTTYSFQVRAIGGSTGYSDWSNTVSRICW